MTNLVIIISENNIYTCTFNAIQKQIQKKSNYLRFQTDINYIKNFPKSKRRLIINKKISKDYKKQCEEEMKKRERSSNSLVIMKRQIKTIIRSHFYPIRLTKFKMISDSSIRENMGNQASSRLRVGMQSLPGTIWYSPTQFKVLMPLVLYFYMS